MPRVTHPHVDAQVFHGADCDAHGLLILHRARIAHSHDGLLGVDGDKHSGPAAHGQCLVGVDALLPTDGHEANVEALGARRAPRMHVAKPNAWHSLTRTPRAHTARHEKYVAPILLGVDDRKDVETDRVGWRKDDSGQHVTHANTLRARGRKHTKGQGRRGSVGERRNLDVAQLTRAWNVPRIARIDPDGTE